MGLLRSLVCLAVVSGAFPASQDATPISKVIDLIAGLAAEVEADGKSEAKAYDDFSCFCKDTSNQKSKSVQKGKKTIDLLAADIADKTQEQKDDSTELLKRKMDHNDLNNKLDAETARCAKEKAEYEAEAADLSKAIQGLKDAINSMKTSRPSLLQLRNALGNTIAMAEAMNFVLAPKHKAAAAFLQQSSTVDPSDPEYKFHSNDIIELCDNLLVEYKASKKDLDTEWDKTEKGCNAMKASLRKKLSANSAAMKQLEKDIERLAKEIAAHRGDLVESEGDMKDDEQYLKDLTARCEDRANDYDQRSAMRGSELGALTSALDTLKKGVRGAANAVNKRALLVQTVAAAVAPSAKKTVPVATEAVTKAISFLQGASTSAAAREARKQQAIDVLRKTGSFALVSLAERVAADPFKKVKGLIQKLIEIC